MVAEERRARGMRFHVAPGGGRFLGGARRVLTGGVRGLAGDNGDLTRTERLLLRRRDLPADRAHVGQHGAGATIDLRDPLQRLIDPTPQTADLTEPLPQRVDLVAPGERGEVLVASEAIELCAQSRELVAAVV